MDKSASIVMVILGAGVGLTLVSGLVWLLWMRKNATRRIHLSTLVLSVLLLSALVGMVVIHQNADKAIAKAERLQEENDDFRARLGIIEVSDGEEDRLHVIGVRTTEEDCWTWRAYLPAERPFFLCHSFKVPGSGVPKAYEYSHLGGSGLMEISVAVTKNKNNEPCWFTSAKGKTGGTSFRKAIPASVMKAKGRWVSQDLDEADGLAKLIPGQHKVLLRIRCGIQMPDGSTYYPANETTEGIMVWISEQKPGMKKNTAGPIRE